MLLRSQSLLLLAVIGTASVLLFLLEAELSSGSVTLAPTLEAAAVINPGETAPIRTERAELQVPCARKPVAGDAPPRGEGSLQVRAIDSETGARIGSIRVRAATEERLADKSSDSSSGEAILRLSAGTYSVLVMSTGYEPAELGTVRVDDQARISLDDVVLQRGRGRVLGTVSGDVPGDDSVAIELRGDGRHPCARCLSPYEDFCPYCGYAARVSRLPLSRSGRFAFENLASGPCTVFLTDREGRLVGAPVQLEVRDGEALALTLEFPGVRELRLEILDADGVSVSAEWASRLARALDPKGEADTLFERPSRSPRFEGLLRSDAFEVARLDWSPPPRDPRRGGTFCCRTRCCGVVHSGRRDRVDDRPRGSDERLRPRTTVPTVEVPRVRVEVDPDGLVRVERMPGSSLTLTLTCGRFGSTVVFPAGVGATSATATLSTPDGGLFRDYETRLGSSE